VESWGSVFGGSEPSSAHDEPLAGPTESEPNNAGHAWEGASCVYLGFMVVRSRRAHVIQILTMCDTMRSLGIETELLAFPAGASAPSGHQIKDSFALDHEPVVKWIPVDSNKWIAALRRGWESYRAVRRHDFTYTRHSLEALAALLGGSRHVIFELHQPEIRRSDRLALQFARHSRRLQIVCISRQLARIVAETHGLDASVMIVAHNGTKLAIDRDYDAASAAGRRLVASYVGTFAPGRGLETILSMAEQLPDIDFVVVGGEAPYDALPSNVGVRPWIAHDEVPDLLAGSDVLLMPYTRNCMLPDGKGGTGEYCSPLKMFEYLAAGRSITASDLPSIAEVLVDGSNALLVEELAVDDWCAALGRLASDPELRRRLARGAAETAEQHTLERRVGGILDEVWSRR